MTLEIVVDAPYVVRFSEDTDGSEATNALLEFRVHRADRSIPGLQSAVRQRMA
jgi:hypothetical protein